MSLVGPKTTTTLRDIQAHIAAGGSVSVVNVTGVHANPGMQKLISDCANEMSDGKISEAFIRELSHFNRPPSDRNLKTKLEEAGKNEAYYDFAIEAKESFAKFFEVVARHPSGQKVLVAAFSHAYSVFREKIFPELDILKFTDQTDIFEAEVVLYLSHNLTSMPGFYGRNEALGLLFYLADNCFIEYAHV